MLDTHDLPQTVGAGDRPWLPPAALAAKALLFACLAHALVHADLPQYQDKAMGYRLVLYPGLALLLPVLWVGVLRRRGGTYPWIIDLCLVLPFLLDAAGNTADLYDSVEWWDDLMHVATWGPWVAAFGFFVADRSVRRTELVALVVAFGAVTIIGWELAEYLTFVADHRIESVSAYRDTIGDMVGSLLGTVAGTVAVVSLTERRGTWA
jgi:hypothetical protein